jgi:uncharacterized membrane protein
MPEDIEVPDYVSLKLRVRLIIYFLVAFGIVAYAVHQVLVDDVPIFYPVIGLVVGVGVGALSSRMLAISWDKDARQVNAHLDATSIAFIALYIVFEIFKQRITEYFVHDGSIVATSFALLGGIMFGRFLGMQGRVLEVLRKNLFFH